MNRDDERWYRPEEVLLDNEFHRAEAFVELCDDMVRRISEVPESPTPLERIAARTMAAAVWRCDRETGDKVEILHMVKRFSDQTLVDGLSDARYNESRRNAFSHADERARLRRVHAADAKTMLDMLNDIRRSTRHYRPEADEEPVKPALTFMEGGRGQK